MVCYGIFWSGQLVQFVCFETENKKKRFDKKQLWYLVNIFSLDIRKSFTVISKYLWATFHDICGQYGESGEFV